MDEQKFQLLREAAMATQGNDPAGAMLVEAALDVVESLLTDLHRVADALENIAANSDAELMSKHVAR